MKSRNSSGVVGAAEHGVVLDRIDLSHVESFVAGMLSVTKADTPPQLIDGEVQEIAEQVCSLLLRFREVAKKIGAADLHTRFPDKLRHNLHIALADAHGFVAGLHAAWAKPRDVRP